MTSRRTAISRAVLWASISLGVLILLATLGLVLSTRTRRGLPYRDSFSSGEAREWQSFGGTWEVTDGAVRDESNERGAKLITGSPKWQDYSIEGDMMLRSITGYASDAGFVLRSSDEEEGVYAYNGYFAMLHQVKNEGASFLLGRVGQGPAVMNSVKLPLGIQTGTWYHMKLLALGCRLVASVHPLQTNNSYVIDANDPQCLRHGRSGLLSSHAGGVWRNITIQEASQLDAASMIVLTPQKASSVAVPVQSDLGRPISATTKLESQDSTKLAAPTVSISKARLNALTRPGPVTVTGQVILLSPVLFIQDPTGGLPVQTLAATQLKIGDEVSASGTVSTDGTQTTLANASVHVLWEGTPIPAVSVTASRVATGAYDGTYIELEGTLTGKHVHSPDLLALDFNSRSQSFEAVMRRDRIGDIFRDIELRSLVRLHGVATQDPRYRGNHTTFAVLVRSTDDVQIIAGPPWWRLRNLVLVATLLMLAILMVGLLQRRFEQWRLLAVIQERERLAYEMHDTLAQSVAGIGFQLEAIRATIPQEKKALQLQLELAQELVRHSHAEARRSIDMLRPQEVQTRGLLAALRDCANRLVVGNRVKVIANSTGVPRSIDLSSTDALFRIGQEALANAVRHAAPTTLKIQLDYRAKGVELSVHDDGLGFKEDQDRQTLGLMSMRKRAEAVSANLIIQSIPGEGTTVTVFAPTSGTRTRGTWREILGIKRIVA